MYPEIMIGDNSIYTRDITETSASIIAVLLIAVLLFRHFKKKGSRSLTIFKYVILPVVITFTSLMTIGAFFGRAARYLNDTMDISSMNISVIADYGGTHFIGRILFLAIILPPVFRIIYGKNEWHIVINYIALFIPIQHIGNRLGCFFHGCCYGKPVDSFPGIKFPDVVSTNKVLPTQIFEAIFMVVLLLIVIILLIRKMKHVFEITLVGFAVAIFISEFYMDRSGIITYAGMTAIQYIAIILAMIAFLIFIFGKFTFRKKSILSIIIVFCVFSQCIYECPVNYAMAYSGVHASSYDMTVEGDSYDLPWHITDTGCPSLWSKLEEDNKKPGQDVVVAVIDTGLDISCNAFEDALWVNEAERDGAEGVDDDGNGYIDDINGLNLANSYTKMIDTDGHGTEMAGIIAGRQTVSSNEGDELFTGIAYGAKLMPVRVSTDTNFPTAKMIEGINYAVKMGADIINLSCVTFIENSDLKDAVKNASKSCVVVASAGNQSKDASTGSVGYPAGWDNVIGVMSCDEGRTLSSFSNRDYSETPRYDIVAPGSHIWEMTKGGTLKYGKGTSQSASIVSGGVAILKSLVGDSYDAPGLKELFLEYMDESLEHNSGGVCYHYPLFSLKQIENDLSKWCSVKPSQRPDSTEAPTQIPASTPTAVPANIPTESPTQMPVNTPAAIPAAIPTESPTQGPASSPTTVPADITSMTPVQTSDSNSTPDLTAVSAADPLQTSNTAKTNSQTTSPSQLDTSKPSDRTGGKYITKGIFTYQHLNAGALSVTGYSAKKYRTKKHLVIPDTITYKGKKYRITGIKSKAFINNRSIQTITLGKNINVIEKNAFKNCINIIKIKTKKKPENITVKNMIVRLKKGRKIRL